MPACSTSDQFATLGDVYHAFSLSDFRQHLELPSVLAQLGDPTGLSICDFGCGTGFFARAIKAQGAQRVLGIEPSLGMREQAQQHEVQAPMGIEYAAATAPTFAEQFDVVLAVYVMPYAFSYAQLTDMVASMADLLKPGGKLITLPIHPNIVADDPEYYRPYGFSVSALAPDAFADASIYRLIIDPAAPEIHAAYWSDASIRKSLMAAGLIEIQQHSPTLGAADASRHLSPDFWDAYLSRPHAAIYSAQKPG